MTRVPQVSGETARGSFRTFLVDANVLGSDSCLTHLTLHGFPMIGVELERLTEFLEDEEAFLVV